MATTILVKRLDGSLTIVRKELETLSEDPLTDHEQIINELHEQSRLHVVGVTLPRLVVENHDGKVMTYLDGVKGIVSTADTKEEAVNELMLLIKIKLLYDLGN